MALEKKEKRSRPAASKLGIQEGWGGGEVGGHEVEVEEHEEDVEGEHLEEETGFAVGFKVFYKSCKGFH